MKRFVETNKALSMLYIYKEAMPSRDENSELKDRREVEREEAHSGAYIVCQGRPNVMDCRILDLSPRGARIWLTDIAGIPKFFELHTPDGEAYLCELVRRKADHIGVQFLERN